MIRVVPPTMMTTPQIAEASRPSVSIPTAGAAVTSRGVAYRVWAPGHDGLVARVEGREGAREIVLAKDAAGYHAGLDSQGAPGDLYRYIVDGAALPDPASRHQPEGVQGPSRVVDPEAYQWRSEAWRRPPWRGRVVYELHAGAFTAEGTFAAAARRLDYLADLGINTLELMPVADFAGRRNWGYDGVMPYAPARCYGDPDDLRALVDEAHARGLAVMLDVVYNHLGPSGAVLARYSPSYFHASRHTGWGPAPNFSEPAARAFFLDNARMWLDEYRFDGLRLDATHAIEDESEPHFLAELAELARERGAFLVAEDERNEARVITPAGEGGLGLDAVWADDFHHAARVALTRQREAHFADFSGAVSECAQILRAGWLYQGQISSRTGLPRGTPAEHRPAEQFVHCISNHDQVGNRPLGDRLHDVVSPEAYRALSMLLCLTPYTPMLFMGQEWAASSPFYFFTDLPGAAGAGVAEGRRRDFVRHGADYDARTLALMPDPQLEQTFLASRLVWDERECPPHAEVLALYRACLRLRAGAPMFQNPPRSLWSAEQVAENVLGLRWLGDDGDRLLLVGLAPGLSTVAQDGFTLAQPGRRWRLELASNDDCFGGDGPMGPVRIQADRIVLSTPGAVLLREG